MMLHVTYYFSLSHSRHRNLFQGSVRNRRFKTIYLIIKSLLSTVTNILNIKYYFIIYIKYKFLYSKEIYQLYNTLASYIF